MPCFRSLIYYPYSFYIAIALRAILFIYGEWQDQNLDVPFTDVDYYVLDDAAGFVSQGSSHNASSHADFSPYHRSTFRYTPLLAYIMLPNHWTGWQGFGKFIFVLFDLLAGYLLVQMSRSKTQEHATQCSSKSDIRASTHSSHFLQLNGGKRALKTLEPAVTLLWLWNPVVFTISTRGNAESVVCTLIASFFYFLSQRQTALAALFFGLAVHLKIFPILYVWPLYFWFRNQTTLSRNTSDAKWSSLVPIAFLQFGLLSGAVFIGLFLIFYGLYGNAFVYETYLYHLVRQDHRHNFSIYFYYFYLHENAAHASSVARLAAFLPQALLTLFLGWKFYRDLPFACFLLTFTFVTFNKVCTSQYFLWYICFLPLVLYWNPITWRTGFGMLFVWLAAQTIWLHTAYGLEFLGQNHYFKLWLASIAFFIVNILITSRWIQAHIQSYSFMAEKSE